MKNILIFVTFFVCFCYKNTFSQSDTILTKSGNTIRCEIKHIDSLYVYFDYYVYPQYKHVYSISLNEVTKIVLYFNSDKKTRKNNWKKPKK